jgi:activator of HSP90 ATPase
MKSMKINSFTMTYLLPASPKDVYKAWMSTKGHTAMTGAQAKVTAKAGGRFSAWDGYIEGKTLILKPYSIIVQAWRTSEFPEDAPDSRLEITLRVEGKGTRITLIHSEIPRGQKAGYRKGWVDFYFKPMKEYFSREHR